MCTHGGDVTAATNEWHAYPLEEDSGEYLDSFSRLLTMPWNDSVDQCSYDGFLFTKPQKVKTLYGERSDGSIWNFSVWGPELDLSHSKAVTWDDEQHSYTMQNYHFTLKPFSFFQQNIFCGCGCKRVHTGICLPQKLCSRLAKMLEITNDDMRRIDRAIFMQEVCLDLIQRKIGVI